MRWRPSKKSVLWALVGLVFATGAGCAAFVLWPLPKGMLDYRPIASVRILDRDGGLLRELRSRADGRSVPVAETKIPRRLEQAFIAAEDKDFFHHFGISPTAILRAFWQDVKAGRIVAGGSTITQQLARRLVPRERTVWGKLKEALWAMRLEAHISKREVLAQYLNRIPFGNLTFGVSAASHLYFGRPVGALSLGQMAALAALPKGPSAYDPYRHRPSLERRRKWVLSRMAALGMVTSDEARHAAEAPIDLRALRFAFRAPHAVEFIARNLDGWGLDQATVVRTTLDPHLQTDTQTIVREEVDALAARKVSSGAAIVVDNANDQVLAYVGSVDWFRDSAQGQNDGIQMHRQPGSSLKPFAYAEAFRERMTPATLLPDVDTTFRAPAGGYAPKDYDRRERGPVRARIALANSLNIPAVHVADRIGPVRLLKVLRKAGFDALDESAAHYGLGLVLGDGEVSPWEEARAYAGLAHDGVLRPLRIILDARRADGTEIPLRRAFAPRRFADPTAVKQVTDILSDDVARAPSFGLDSVLRLPFPAAVKTGTSKGYSDNWTSGFTHEFTVTAWAGNFDGRPMVEVSGVTGAGPIWRRVMLDAMKGVAHPSPLYDPTGLVRARICPLSGERVGPDCPGSVEELFAPGTVPKATCSMHRHLVSELPPRLADRCARLADGSGRIVDYGTDYYAWAERTGTEPNAHLAPLCAGEPAVSERNDGSAERTARILSPSEGDQFLLLDDLPDEDQTVPLRVRAPPSAGPLAVWLDGARLFTLRAPFTARLPARRGRHRLKVARAANGEALGEVTYQVLGHAAP